MVDGPAALVFPGTNIFAWIEPFSGGSRSRIWTRCSSTTRFAQIHRWVCSEASNTVRKATTSCSNASAGKGEEITIELAICVCVYIVMTFFLGKCSYAGLHCVVIKGYSKSAGYQPGVRFEDNRFRNSWNAVYVAGAWRFVQCNWGARHLVNAKEVPKPGSKSKSDSLRYDVIIFSHIHGNL